MQLDIDLTGDTRLRIGHPALDRDPDTDQLAQLLTSCHELGPTATVILMHLNRTRTWSQGTLQALDAAELCQAIGIGPNLLRRALNRLDRYRYIDLRPALTEADQQIIGFEILRKGTGR